MEKTVISWRIEAVTLVFIVICISLAFYLAFLSFQTFNEDLRKQLVAFAASFLITGITVFAALTVHMGIKKVFSGTYGSVKSDKEASTTNED